MEGHHHHLHRHQHQHQQPLHQPQPQPQPQTGVNVDPSSSDRFPQWSVQETKEFLMIRAELDQTFMETKRNKPLWEVISTKMKEKGYSRSAEQCKCKWKNLVTRYKGCETIEAEAMRQQFPFFNDMQTIFGARIQRMLWAETEGGASSSSRKKPMQTPTLTALYSEEEEEEEEEDSEEERGRKKKKAKSGGNTGSNSGGGSREVRRLLEDFMKQQLEMEGQWREAFEARENERRAKEMEWRQMMEALEKERIMMDRRWREREEQRRAREEVRAEKRDALVTALLNKLHKSEHDHM